MFEGIRRQFIDKIEKVQMLLDTPGAFEAKKSGCYLSVYYTLYRLLALGLNPLTVLDIGANRGMFARTIHHLFPKADILAFEPLADCYDDLCSLKDSIKGLECYDLALSDQAGEDCIHRSSYDYSSSLLKMGKLHKQIFPYSSGERLVRIRKERLDTVLSNRELRQPVLMKIDVQGYEKFVLEGATQSLMRVDYVLCELSFVSLYEKQPLFDTMYTYLTEKGFRFVGHIAENRNPRTMQLLQIDGLFVRDSLG